MFLSKRERPSDTSPASNKASHIAYKRTSIPSISVVSLLASGSSTGSSAQRRAPLAPLDPQLAPSPSLDDQMPSTSTHTSSRPDRSQRLDSSRDGDVARANIGRQIIARPLDDDDSNIQPFRKRSIPSHNTPRSLPYPPRSTQRRASNTPSVNSTRRPSVPSISNPSQNTHPSGLPSQPTQSLADPGLYGGDDIYSNLSTYTFGAPKVNASQMSDSSDMISPLTRVSGSGSADRTPRPSVSGASGGRRKSYSSKVSDPAEGDDEYEDEDDDARGKARSKMRAIDDGTRRPSLPTNSLAAISTASTPPPSSSSNPDSEASPTSRSSHESELDSSEPEGDEGEAAEFDTDVELDMSHDHHTNGSLDPPMSDAASQRTFGPGSFDHYGYWRSPFDGQSRSKGDDEDEDEDDIDSISPVTFKHEDEEGYDDGDRPLPSLASSRRGSVPWETLSPRSLVSGRDREDSTKTIVAPRGSRSVENLTISSPEPIQSPRRDNRPLDGQGDTSPQDESVAVNDEFQYGPYDLNYILSGVEPRKSWSSGSASYVQAATRRQSGDPYSLAASWDTDLFRNARRPSTATIGSSEDAFTKHVRALDPDYNAREERWSFKRESSDGRGPHRMQLAASPSQTPSVPTPHTMMPQTQEMWRQDFVGRYKVDRLRLPSETRSREKGPQQRVHVRHIPDPYLKGNIRGGPHAVIHKHSRVVAFSIFRHNNVLPPHTRKDRTPFDRSGGILLANKKVQEAYTSTHTTSRLNSHGLLADADSRGYDGSTVIGTPSSISGHSRPSTPGHSDASVRRSGPASIDMTRNSSSPPPPPNENIDRQNAPSSSSSAVALDTASSSDYSGRAGPSSSIKTRSSTMFSQGSHSRYDSADSDDSDSPPRTSHAEAFATVDSSYYEVMRARAAQRHAEDPQPISRLSALRKLFGPQRNASTHGSGSSPAQREGNYNPPWVVLAPRSKQEESQRVIQNLNESFQDVGLLPANSKSTSRGKNHKSKHRQDRRDRQPGSILEKVPKDSLYMLLPLWPGEVYPASKLKEDPTLHPLRVEDRQYLLVYYVPFEDKERRKTDHNKKRSRGSKGPSSSTSGSTVDLPLFLLRSFRVNARLVSYDDLRGTGVRVPSYGLTVTGPMAEAMRYLPSPSIREQRLDEVVICHCTSRNSGMKFDPDGLSKLGLCMPTETPAAMQIPDSVIPEPEEAILTPIGRAAVEMAWLGCMAVTSFGTV
ncbi:hypothetical protein BDY19DRAFT_1045374 [Irpex rosettiformis]|uniref:Uncharacterized protein n=1 Tax=Irpex rosettiformis TaxID=378272 RepID=A0ACB8UFX3_9APHY|nr:hypothetical protein BDY19DRAFT_1045374 [Irpex rosettiformis]